MTLSHVNDSTLAKDNTYMRITLRRAAAGVVATASLLAAGLIPTAADAALTAGAAAAGTATLSPTSGTSGTTFTLTPPAGAACPGDSATGGYRWTTFMVPRTVDVSQLTYTALGPVAPAGVTFAKPLYSNTGSPVTAKTTGVGDGLLTGIPTFGFGNYTAGQVPAGEYKIGFACTLSNVTEKYWETALTVATNASTGGTGQFDWKYGWVPAAPVLGGTPDTGDGSLAFTFTHDTSTPATTGYTVSYTPSGGSASTQAVTSGATSFTLSSLTNGTSYTVTIKATNSTGDSAASNSVVATPNPDPYPAVTSLQATPGVEKVTLTWVAPATGGTPSSYSISYTPSGGSASTTTATGAATSKEITGLTSGVSYSFVVTPQYTSPYTGTASSSVSAVPQSNQLVYQDITVVRPTGALVITQRCGVYGALPEVAADSTLGFPLLAAASASVDRVGTAPTVTGGGSDTEFGNYPNPDTPTYPTTCGADMGTAELVTSGTNAGNYFYATGRLNQISIADTRDTDSGWSINGTMGTFTVTGGGTSSFSGDALGWQPIVSSDSAAYDDGTGTYNQTVTTGATIAPFATNGLTDTQTLAEAAAGAGLGLATIDARLKLLVPVTAPAGTYTGTLTFTII